VTLIGAIERSEAHDAVTVVVKFVPASLRRPPAVSSVLTARMLLRRLLDENAALSREIARLRAGMPALLDDNDQLPGRPPPAPRRQRR